MRQMYFRKIDYSLLTILKKFEITPTCNDLKKLSQDIEDILAFQKKLPNLEIKNLCYPQTKQEIIEVFTLRSRVYKREGYDREFPQFIDGLDYDEYDKTSAVLCVKFNNKITGSCRVVFDSPLKLPIEKNYPFDYLRAQRGELCELSRLVVERESLGQEPRLLTKGTYLLLRKKGISTLVSITDKKAYNRYYKNFGGFRVEHEYSGYGKLEKTFIVSSWEIAKVSPFFKRAFLKN